MPKRVSLTMEFLQQCSSTQGQTQRWLIAGIFRVGVFSGKCGSSKERDLKKCKMTLF